MKQELGHEILTQILKHTAKIQFCKNAFRRKIIFWRQLRIFELKVEIFQPKSRFALSRKSLSDPESLRSRKS